VALLHDRACSSNRECGAGEVAAILRQRVAMMPVGHVRNSEAACGADGLPGGATQSACHLMVEACYIDGIRERKSLSRIATSDACRLLEKLGGCAAARAGDPMII
jgi:hypothetical protein